MTENSKNSWELKAKTGLMQNEGLTTTRKSHEKEKMGDKDDTIEVR